MLLMMRRRASLAHAGSAHWERPRDNVRPVWRAQGRGALEKTLMHPDTQTVSGSKKKLWAGYLLSALPTIFLLLDGVLKLVKPTPVVESTVQLGYPESAIVGIGILLLVCVILYVIPRTSVLGAILLTGYLGGAVASQVRIGGSLFPILFPVIIGVLIWSGPYLRDKHLRGLIPLRT